MTNIVSAISGQFSKSLILAAFLPVVTFAILFQVLGVPLLPIDWSLFKPLEAVDTQWRLVAFSFVTLIASGLLYNLNIPIMRFYEGYPWKDSWAGQWRIRRYEAEFDSLHARWNGVRTLWRALDPSDQRSQKIATQLTKLGQRANNDFPDQRSLVLPTRLGNVIRSFESYPSHQYKMAAIALWPRLVAELDNDYALAIDDAKTALDFTLNASALSAIWAFAIFVVGLSFGVPLAVKGGWAPWLLEVVASTILSYLFYLASIGRAHAWGETVKGAFDLYRWDLLTHLGYKRLPTTMEEERALWDDISLQMIYGDTPSVRLAQYDTTPTHARGEPYVTDLEIARGVSSPGSDGAYTVFIRVVNIDAKKRTASNVVVTDSLPEGFDYGWDSARAGNRKVPTVGANPYQFEIGTLAFGEDRILSYQATPRAGGRPMPHESGSAAAANEEE